MFQGSPDFNPFNIFVLILICFFLVVPGSGVFFSILIFSLCLMEGRYYWEVFGLGSDLALIVVIIILVTCAILYAAIAIRKKIYYLLIQTASYSLPIIAIILLLL